MSDSNSDSKKTNDEVADVNEVKADSQEKVAKVRKTTKAVKAKAVVADSAEAEKEPVTVAPYMASGKNKEVKKSSSSTATYMAIAAGVLLALTLTTVIFFQQGYESVVASFTSDTAADEAGQNAGLAENGAESNANGVHGFDPMMQANYGNQPYAENQARANSFDELRQNRRAAYDESVRRHDQRMAEMYQLRTAAMARMNTDQAEMRNRMEIMQAKTRQIQLEMQQKMQAAYEEFYAI